MEKSRIPNPETPNIEERESINADTEEAAARRQAAREWLANYMKRVQQAAQIPPQKK